LGYCAPETVYLRVTFKHHDKDTYHVLHETTMMATHPALVAIRGRWPGSLVRFHRLGRPIRQPKRYDFASHLQRTP
jgi:hypothetical protein